MTIAEEARQIAEKAAAEKAAAKKKIAEEKAQKLTREMYEKIINLVKVEAKEGFMEIGIQSQFFITVFGNFKTVQQWLERDGFTVTLREPEDYKTGQPICTISWAG